MAGYQPYVTSSSSSSAGRTSQQPSSSSARYTPYGSRPTTTPSSTASSYNPYGATAPTAAAVATSTVPASSYNQYSSPPAAATSNGLPDFSQALDLPPPPPAVVHNSVPPSSNPQQYYQQHQYRTQQQYQKRGEEGDSITATAYPVAASGTSGAYSPSISVTNSTVYKGGPTNGLVSEGNPTKCHKIDYEIKGAEMQLVEIELDPQEVVIAEAGGMMYMEEGITFKTKFGDGSEPKQGFFKKLMAAGGRLLTGESLFITHFHNDGQTKARVAFAAPFPGNIVPLNLATIGGSIICQRDAFLCAAKGTKLSMTFNKRIGSGFFGGEGFILQKLQGDGMAFVHACGTIIKRELHGERIRLDTGCLVAFTEGIDFNITMDHGFKSMIFGGEGLFLATLQGHGTVWMQSLPFSRMADRIVQSAPSAGGKRVGEGNRLTGGFGGLIDGDGF